MLTYNQAADLMKKARHGRRKLENNTYLVTRSPGEGWAGTVKGKGPHYAVRLHATDVVTIHPDGSYTYDSDGWRTVTTKARMNTYGNAAVWSDRGSWLIARRRNNFSETEQTAQPFADGVTVHADGRITGAGVDESLTRRRLLKQVREYIAGFVAHVKANGLPDPSPGDCWGCYMVPKEDRARPAGFGDLMGIDHYLSHMEEGYYVPSLLWRAVQRCGNPSFVYGLIQRGNVDLLERELRAYFKKLMPALVEHYVTGTSRHAA